MKTHVVSSVDGIGKLLHRPNLALLPFGINKARSVHLLVLLMSVSSRTFQNIHMQGRLRSLVVKREQNAFLTILREK